MNISTWCRIHPDVSLFIERGEYELNKFSEFEPNKFIKLKMETETLPKGFIVQELHIGYIDQIEYVIDQMYWKLMHDQKKEELRIENERLNSMMERMEHER